MAEKPHSKTIEALRLLAGTESNTELAKILELTPARVSQMQDNLTKKSLEAACKKISNHNRKKFEEQKELEVHEIYRKWIQPVVEFFPIEQETKFKKEFIDSHKEDRRLLKKRLTRTCGVYAFYNSELEVVYLGKAETCLWTEMKQAYSREYKQYKKFYPQHEYKVDGTYKFVEIESGLTPPIKQEKVGLPEVSSYFSAYFVKKEMIKALESILIRMFVNEVINKKIEGNGTLKAYRN